MNGWDTLVTLASMLFIYELAVLFQKEKESTVETSTETLTKSEELLLTELAELPRLKLASGMLQCKICLAVDDHSMRIVHETSCLYLKAQRWQAVKLAGKDV